VYAGTHPDATTGDDFKEGEGSAFCVLTSASLS